VYELTDRFFRLILTLERQSLHVLQEYFKKSLPLFNSLLLPYLSNVHVIFNIEKQSQLNRSQPGIYTLFTASQYSANTELPVRSIEPAYRQCFDEIVRTYMENVNGVSRHLGRFLEYKKTLYGYYKHEPRHGMNYILDLYLMYRKYSGKKMSVGHSGYVCRSKERKKEEK
jgi:hypothetical protein